MVSPEDVGRAGAGLLLAREIGAGPVLVEGPERLTSTEVAAAFARVLGRQVAVEIVPPDKVEAMFAGLGFSPAAARAYARMTAAAIEDAPGLPPATHRGAITLDEHLARLVAAG